MAAPTININTGTRKSSAIINTGELLTIVCLSKNNTEGCNMGASVINTNTRELASCQQSQT